MQRTKNILAYQHITVTGKNNACSLKDFSLSSGISEIVSIFGKKEDGLETVPCVFVDHLTEAQKKAYIIADNAS